MKLPVANGHDHDFDISAMEPTDTWHHADSTLNGRDGSDYHDHDVSIHFDSDKKVFIVETSPGGSTFATQHIHPKFEIPLGQMDGGIIEPVINIDR